LTKSSESDDDESRTTTSSSLLPLAEAAAGAGRGLFLWPPAAIEDTAAAGLLPKGSSSSEDGGEKSPIAPRTASACAAQRTTKAAWYRGRRPFHDDHMRSNYYCILANSSMLVDMIFRRLGGTKVASLNYWSRPARRLHAIRVYVQHVNPVLRRFYARGTRCPPGPVYLCPPPLSAPNPKNSPFLSRGLLGVSPPLRRQITS